MGKGLAVIVLLVACGKSDSPSGATGSASIVIGSASNANASGSNAASGSATGSAGSAANVVVPLPPRVTAARCDEPCLFLVDTPIDKLVDAYKTACNKDTAELGITDCKALDYARNCIYAAHGKVYKKKKWTKLFAKKTWYERHPDFVEASLGTVEKANIKELYHRGKACKKGGVHVSAADYDRVAQWFAALPKPMTPALTFGSHGDKLGTDAFVKELYDNADELVKANKKLDISDATLAYTDLATDAGDMDFEKPLRDALPKGKLRAVLADIALPGSDDEENPVSEGAFVLFVYDDKDRLVGLATDHYLFD